MAQELCKQKLPSAEVFSRGLYADSSYTVPQKVLDFLQKQGILPTPHNSTQLQGEDLQKADFVFCMEQNQVDQLLDRYAQHTDKIYLLNDFAFGKETDVPDPVSLSGHTFEKNAQKLMQAVYACADKLKQGVF